MREKVSVLFFLALIFTTQGLSIPISSDKNHVFKTNDIAQKTENKTKVNYRLPSDVEPTNYQLTLTPHLEGEKKFTFDGSVMIKLTVLNETAEIVFHARNLTFTKADIELEKEGLENEIIDFELSTDEKTDFVKIKTTGNYKFKEGSKYKLKIKKFSGILADDMHGFYRSSYVNQAGEKVWLATTHFEPVDARRAFPCFDEPAFKATFDITIVHDKKYKAISNKPVEKSEPIDNKNETRTKFLTTPKMSTYLVAFVVSNFESKHNADNFTVYAKADFINHTSVALESGPKLLKALEDFTQVTYDMGKMDQVGIPDFAAGAMENWGLVLYKEKSLLFDGNTSTTSNKQNIVETIAHEFAHQWFGNLVSPKWWKYIWLNEGFANFFQSYITDKVEPEWRSVEQSVVKSIQTAAFDFDCESKTHPINHDVDSPEEIRALFDSISYKKGGAIIRMMQHFLTEEIFRKGLNIYLKNNTVNHSAADSDDLFNAIQKAVKSKDINLTAIMNTWVNFKGYPVVKVTRSNDSKSITVTQERFYTYEPSEEEKNSTHVWHIPINFAREKNLEFSDTSVQHWLTKKTDKIPITIDANEFIILNKQQTGYYRVQYDEENWDLIIKYLNLKNHTSIHVLNRAQLINDALAFAKQGKLKLSILLNLIEHLQYETDYIAWYPGFKAFSWLKSKLMDTEIYPAFKDFASKTMKPLIESVGFKEARNESEKAYLTKLNRITAVDWACKLNVKSNETSCITETQKVLESWLEDSNKTWITPDLKQVTLCNGLRYATFEIWNKALNKSDSSTNNDEKKMLISALACSSDKNILDYYFNYTLKENSHLKNETLKIVEYIHKNSEVGIDVTLDIIKYRFSALLQKHIDTTKITPVLLAVSKKITTTAQFEKLQSIKDTDFPEHAVMPAIEEAKKNIDWLKENQDIIKSAMERSNKNGVELFSTSILLISALIMLNIFVC